MDNVEIMPVASNDVAELQDIGVATFSETFAAINTEDNMKKYLEDSFSIKQLSTELNNQLSQFYFAKLYGKVIGYMKLNIGSAQKENSDENALEIERIYVGKDFHGKKVGQLLYDKAIIVANEMAVEYVWLGVWEHNFRAMAFYKKNGFVAFDQHVFMLGNDRQIDILMKKVLEVKN